MLESQPQEPLIASTVWAVCNRYAGQQRARSWRWLSTHRTPGLLSADAISIQSSRDKRNGRSGRDGIYTHQCLPPSLAILRSMDGWHRLQVLVPLDALMRLISLSWRVPGKSHATVTGLQNCHAHVHMGTMTVPLHLLFFHHLQSAHSSAAKTLICSRRKSC